MFEQKDRVKYISEGLRNIGVALAAGGMIGYAAGSIDWAGVVLVCYGLFNFYCGYLILKD